MHNDITIYDDNEYQVFFSFDAWYTPAKLCGPPERCYPEEGGSEYQINEIRLNGVVKAITELPTETIDMIEYKVNQWVEEEGLSYIEDNDCRDWDD